jgi:hypothetical protein
MRLSNPEQGPRKSALGDIKVTDNFRSHPVPRCLRRIHLVREIQYGRRPIGNWCNPLKGLPIFLDKANPQRFAFFNRPARRADKHAKVPLPNSDVRR